MFSLKSFSFSAIRICNCSGQSSLAAVVKSLILKEPQNSNIRSKCSGYSARLALSPLSPKELDKIQERRQSEFSQVGFIINVLCISVLPCDQRFISCTAFSIYESRSRRWQTNYAKPCKRDPAARGVFKYSSTKRERKT